jgi:dienelactone hydrolase
MKKLQGARCSKSKFLNVLFPLLFVYSITLSACSGVERALPTATLADPSGWTINRELIPHSKDSAKKVELFWTKPAGDRVYPAVLFIHGHQEEAVTEGGEAYVKLGRLRSMVEQGYVAAAVSQPGYGYSDGPRDYCGPFTQDAVLSALAFLRTMPFVNPDKVAILGYSRGAITASMVATQDPRLAAVVLGAGAYDFSKMYPTTLRGIQENIRIEAGTSDQAFKARSAIYHAEKIKAPILLLHGGRDERIQVQQAEAFAEQLKANGITYKIRVFPNAGHAIPISEQYREIDPFLTANLKPFKPGQQQAVETKKANTFIAENEIKNTFAGNTILFPEAKTKMPIHIYFHLDGGFSAKYQGRLQSGSWWIGKGGTFCREYSDGSMQSCLKPARGGDNISFYDTNNRLVYTAKLLKGKQLP